MTVFTALIIPFIGTALGASLVFFMRNKMGDLLQKALLGFASGVMIAASIWSLINPSIEMAKEQGVTAWLPAAVGFVGGMCFLLLLDTITPHLHLDSDKPEGRPSGFKKSTMLMLAVTLHNIPEGMAVGVTIAGALSGDGLISLAGAFALSIGIAIQNFPEGAIISMPLREGGFTRRKAFLFGAASGIVEPAAGLVTVLLTGLILPLLPYLLSFAAGAMIYVVVEELIPEAQTGRHTNIGTMGVAAGFTLMMILDIALG